MTRPIDENDLRKYLTPFADGELSVEQSLRVLEHMAMSPQATRRVMHQQQLRQAIGRHLLSRSPEVPGELHKRLDSLLAPPDTMPPSAQRRWWNRAPLAAAAIVMMAVGMWIGHTMMNPTVSGVTPTTAPANGSVPVTLVNSVTRTHVYCSRFAAHNHSKLFPTDLSKLPEAMKKYLGCSAAAPDLDEMGYTFVGAEACPIPGAKTVHLLYRAKNPAMRDTISVFVQPDHGQLDIRPDHVHIAAGRDAAHQVMVWRSSGVIYYLVGDAMNLVTRAAKLTGAPV